MQQPGNVEGGCEEESLVGTASDDLCTEEDETKDDKVGGLASRWGSKESTPAATSSKEGIQLQMPLPPFLS